MRLIDLDPKWLIFEGRRVGFIFRCPLAGKRQWWQTCFVERFPVFRRGRHRGHCQEAIIAASAPEAANWFQGCDPNSTWEVAGGIESADFATISVTPSLDGSKGGLWHGFVKSGEIAGGI